MVRERRAAEELRCRTQSREWAQQHFPRELHPAAESVAFGICEIERLDAAQFRPSSHLIEDLRMTDLEPVQLAIHLEKDFGIKIVDSDAEQLSTLSDWVDYVQERVARLKT